MTDKIVELAESVYGYNDQAQVAGRNQRENK